MESLETCLPILRGLDEDGLFCFARPCRVNGLCFLVCNGLGAFCKFFFLMLRDISWDSSRCGFSAK